MARPDRPTKPPLRPPQALRPDDAAGLGARLGPDAQAFVERARGRGFHLDPIQRDATGRAVGAGCPLCDTPIIGLIRVGEPTRHPVTRDLEWNVMLGRLSSARYVVTRLELPGGETELRLSYCADCAERLRADPDDLEDALGAEVGLQAIQASRAGILPERTRDLFETLAAARIRFERIQTVEGF